MATIPNNVRFYHAHTYFDKSSRSSAAALRARLQQEFAGRVRIHGLIDEPIGPHSLPMFEMDIVSDDIDAVKAWLSAHHGVHSILIHPLTGDDLADHRDFPMWIGTPLPLDLEFLKHHRLGQ